LKGPPLNTDIDNPLKTGRADDSHRVAAKKEKALERTVRRERAILCAGYLRGELDQGEEPLQELEQLVDTAGASVVGRLHQNIHFITGKTYIGKGKAHEVKDLVEATDADVVVFDNDLSPSQSVALEEIIQTRIIDRSELILDIFASRAVTHLAKMQVSLAMLEYRLPRLKRLWSHLERQKGGMGLRSGPGEKQIESDRRVIREHIKDYRKRIAEATTQRERLTQSRTGEHFVASLVGYTNAGKTTLMNALTGSDLYADDRLFATLDSRARLFPMSSGKSVMLTDTVGFIQRLPHHLIASFNATLQESLNADLMLQVIDAASPLLIKHLHTVEETLVTMGASERPRLMVFNKADAVEDAGLLESLAREYPGAVFVSAKKRTGFDDLEAAILDYYQRKSVRHKLKLPASDGKALAYISRHGFDETRDYQGDQVLIDVQIEPDHIEHLYKLSRNLTVISPTRRAKKNW
jgi:GTP-binding protein HflX